MKLNFWLIIGLMCLRDGSTQLWWEIQEWKMYSNTIIALISVWCSKRIVQEPDLEIFTYTTLKSANGNIFSCSQLTTILTGLWLIKMNAILVTNLMLSKFNGFSTMLAPARLRVSSATCGRQTNLTGTLSVALSLKSRQMVSLSRTNLNGILKTKWLLPHNN